MSRGMVQYYFHGKNLTTLKGRRYSERTSLNDLINRISTYLRSSTYLIQRFDKDSFYPKAINTLVHVEGSTKLDTVRVQEVVHYS